MSPKKPFYLHSYPKWRPAELLDLERLEGQTMTGSQYKELTFRWSQVRDERLEIEDRVTDLLRTRARRRAKVREALATAGQLVLVLLVSIAIGLFARSLP
jgi:hypothetical protein